MPLSQGLVRSCGPGSAWEWPRNPVSLFGALGRGQREQHPMRRPVGMSLPRGKATPVATASSRAPGEFGDLRTVSSCMSVWLFPVIDRLGSITPSRRPGLIRVHCVARSSTLAVRAWALPYGCHDWMNASDLVARGLLSQWWLVRLTVRLGVGATGQESTRRVVSHRAYVF